MMLSFAVLLTLVVFKSCAQSATDSWPSQCLKHKTRYLGDATADFADVLDMVECSQHLLNNSNYRYWSFDEEKQTCHLNEDNEATTDAKDAKFTSGDKHCYDNAISCMAFDSSDSNMPLTSAHKVNAYECYKLCKGSGTCKNWLWREQSDSGFLINRRGAVNAHEKFGKYGKCWMSNGTAAITNWDNSLTGKKDCSSRHIPYIIQTGVEYRGDDIGYAEVFSATQCNELCLLNLRCAFWTFHHKIGGQLCRFKGSSSAAIDMTDRVSGMMIRPPNPVYCIEDRVKYTGEPIDQQNVTGIDACHALCKEQVHYCEFWTLQKGEGKKNCQVFGLDATRSVENYPNFISGSMSCSAEFGTSTEEHDVVWDDPVAVGIYDVTSTAECHKYCVHTETCVAWELSEETLCQIYAGGSKTLPGFPGYIVGEITRIEAPIDLPIEPPAESPPVEPTVGPASEASTKIANPAIAVAVVFPSRNEENKDSSSFYHPIIERIVATAFFVLVV